MESNEERLDKIAKKIVSSLPVRKASSVVHVETPEGVKALEVRTVTIIIEGARKNTRRKVSAAQRKPAVRLKSPFYPTEEIRKCLEKTPARIQFSQREDGKADPKNVNLEKSDAIQIIHDLDKNNYKETLYNVKPPVDVYEKIERIEKKNVKLYIKLRITRSNLVYVISFHESDR